MKRLVWVLLLAGTLSGCVAAEAPPPPAPPPPLASAPARHPPTDACGAGAMQYLIGRKIEELPQSTGRHIQRVIGQSGIYEDVYDPERTTIVYDESNGRITRVRCG